MLQRKHVALMVWAAATSMLVVGQFYVAIPFIGALADFFTISSTRAALVVSAFGFAYAPGMIVWGTASDKWGRVNVLVAGLTAAALFTALSAVTTNFTWLLATRALQGFAASSFSPTTVSLLAEKLPPQSRALGMSVIGFAFLLSAPVVQYVAVASGAPLFTVLAVSAPLLLLSAATVRLIVGPSTKASTTSAGGESRLACLVRDRLILAAWAAATTVLFGFAAFQAALQIVPAAAGSEALAPEHIRLLGMPALLVAFLAPRVTLRHGPVTTTMVGFVVAAGAFIVAQMPFPGALIAASVVVHAGTAMAVPSLMGVVASQADTANRGLALGIYTCILFLGASAAPLAMHMLAPSRTAMFSLPASTLAAAALLLAAARRSAARRAAAHRNPYGGSPDESMPSRRTPTS